MKQSKLIKNTFLSLSTVLLLSACGGGGTSSPDEAQSNNELNQSNATDESNEALIGIASDASDYERLNLKQDSVEDWEDALRTSGKSGSYEWWYSDYTFEDGTTVVVAFYTKLAFDTYGSALPMVNINIVYPDKTVVNDQFYGTPNSIIDASKEITNVHIGDCFIENKEGTYLLHYANGNIEFSATMVSTLPMWRQETGYLYFSEDKQDYFAWLVAQPSSKVKATLSVDGVKKELKGDGYHDHNWGNSPMHENMDNWYWGRAKLGEYTLIFSDIIGHKKYNYNKVPLLLIAKGDKILNINTPIEVERNKLVTNIQTNKSYANQLIFRQSDENNQTFTIKVNKTKDLVFLDMNRLPFETGNNPTYLRTLSDISLSIKQKDGSTETLKGVGITEQMSFEEVIEN